MTTNLRTARGTAAPRLEGSTHRRDGAGDERGFAAPIFHELVQSPPPPGYVWEQFTLTGDVAGEQYRTLLQVIRPEDPARSSGVVVVEPWHRAGYWTLYSKVQGYLARQGHAAAIVLSNANVLESVIKVQDPAAFADLHLPGGEFADSEVIAHAGMVLRSGGALPVAPRKIILGGQSTEAYWVRRFIVQEHDRALVDDRHVFDGYFPAQSALSSPRGIIHDVDVPVVELQGESELIRSFARGGNEVAFRRDDGDWYRLYEVPGMPHVCSRNGASSARLASMNCQSSNWSNFPLFEVFHVALDNLVTWVDSGVAAPNGQRIATRDAGRTIARDAHGNALGGMRTSYFDVPTATIHATCGETPEDLRGERCDFYAWDEPFSAAKLRSLYGSHDEYVARVNDSLDTLVAARWFLAEDAVEFRDEAGIASVP